MKKGVLSIQFHWIFVLIVGAIILSFFLVVAQKQRTVAEENLAGDIQTDLRAIFSSSQVSTGTASIIDVPSRDIQFSCEGFKVGNQFAAQFPYAFGPDRLHSDRNTISVFALDWSVPFRVTNFLYVTSPDVRYIIDPINPTLVEALEEVLPPQFIEKGGETRLFMNRINDSPTGITDQNSYKVRKIAFSNCNSLVNDLQGRISTNNRDISGVCINLDSDCQLLEPEEAIDCHGEVQFFNYNGVSWPKQTSHFVGKASLVAAIFAENKELYDCGMQNAFKRLSSVSEVYIERSQRLKIDPIIASQCEALYTPIIDSLSTIQGEANNPFRVNVHGNIANAAIALSIDNDLLLENSCPPAY